MTPQKITHDILRDVINPENWTPELFNRVKNAPAYSEYYGGFNKGDGRNYITAIFNKIRRTLSPEEYKAFDRAYCGYKRPDLTAIAERLDKSMEQPVKQQEKGQKVGEGKRVQQDSWLAIMETLNYQKK